MGKKRRNNYDNYHLCIAGIPHNPMVNSGAIALCSLIKPAGSITQRVRFVSLDIRLLSNTCSHHNVNMFTDVGEDLLYGGGA